MNYTIEQKKLFDLIAKSERKLHQDYQKFYSKLINLIEAGHSERVIIKWLDKELKVVDKATKKTILDATKSAITLSTNKNTKLLRSLKLQDQFKAQGLTYKPSANIWKVTDESLAKIKTIIQDSFKEGKSNLEVAKDLVSEINSDGQGVGHYKKPIKNAQRLARTEINAVYHKNDSFNWNNFDFVIGKEIRLSNSNKKNARCEICRNMAGEYPKEFVWYNWHPQCYSDDTMVMTKRGWLLFKDLKEDDLIFSLNPINNTPEYVGINKFYTRHQKGDMIHFNSHNLDVLVTPDHPMKYLNHKNEWCEKKAIDFKSGALYRASEWEGEEIESISIGKHTVDFDLYLEFMAYYIGDGSVAHTRQNQSHIAQIQDKSPEKYEQIKKCLDKMPFKVSCSKNGFYFFDNCFYEYLKQFGYSIDKYLPEEILKCSRRQARLFLYFYVVCDGMVRTRNKTFINSRGVETTINNSQNQYFTCSQRLASDLMEMILKAGKRPSFKIDKPRPVKHHNGVYTAKKELYRIYELNSKTSTVFKKDIVQYDGLVYDVELEKNHIMYISRNGKCFWGSNCLCTSIPILLSDEEFRKYELAKLENISYTPPTIPMPKHAIEYAKNKYFKTPPYWMDNFKF